MRPSSIPPFISYCNPKLDCGFAIVFIHMNFISLSGTCLLSLCVSSLLVLGDMEDPSISMIWNKDLCCLIVIPESGGCLRWCFMLCAMHYFPLWTLKSIIVKRGWRYVGV
jgi:hypothetical protein